MEVAYKYQGSVAPVRLGDSVGKFSSLVVERTARLFEAAGDTARLHLLLLLADDELTVTDIAAATQEGISTVSQRLKVLRTEGLVASRRDGKHIYYRLADRHIVELIANALTHVKEQLLTIAGEELK